MDWVRVGEPEVNRQRGKWVVRQRGYDAATARRRVQQLGTFPTKRAAVAHQKALIEGRAGTDSESLADFLEVWLHSKEGRVAVSTFDQYTWAVRGHITPLLGAVRLRDLTAELLDSWIGALTAPGPSGKARLGPTSVRLVRKVLSMAQRQLEVVQQLTVERGRPIIKQLKTYSSDRLVTFGAATANVLLAHRRRQQQEAALLGPGWQDRGLVFTTPLGNWIDPNNFSRIMASLIETAGVPRITPKGLRHTAQSVGRVVVGDDKVMQERLGHADIGITLNTYTHTVSEQHRQAGDRLDEIFAPPDATE